jgi:nodulation protein F
MNYEKYIATLRDHLPYANENPLHGEDELEQLGLDSLGTVRLLATLEDIFDLEIPEEALHESTFRTVDSLWQIVRAAG